MEGEPKDERRHARQEEGGSSPVEGCQTSEERGMCRSDRCRRKERRDDDGAEQSDRHLHPERPLPAPTVGNEPGKRSANHGPGAEDGHHDSLVQPTIAEGYEVSDDDARHCQKASAAELSSAGYPQRRGVRRREELTPANARAAIKTQIFGLRAQNTAPSPKKKHAVSIASVRPRVSINTP